MHAVLLAVTFSALVPGLSVNIITPTLPGFATSSTTAKVNPLDSSLWMSNGRTVYHLDGVGGIVSSESLSSIDGGPLGPVDGLARDLAFDASGALYITDSQSNNIYKRPVAGSWSVFATMPDTTTSDIQFDASGNLIALSYGFAHSITPAGVVSLIGATFIPNPLDNAPEAFVFDPDTGDMVMPRYSGTGIARLTMSGVLSNDFLWSRPEPILYEGMTLTPDGNYLIAVNLGADMLLGNRSRLIRVNKVTGLREIIGEDVVFNVIPVDLLSMPGSIVSASFGSLVGFELVGDIDQVQGFIIPEPSTAVLLALGLLSILHTRRNRPRR